MKIEIQGLNKIYPNGNHALKDINLEFGTGMFGLLGPNGAGKSSLMRILVTLMKPTSGIVLVDGMDIQKHRKELRSLLGYLPQDFRFFTSLKTWEFLDYSGSLAGMKNKKLRISEVDRLLDQVGLLEVRDRQANRLSGGMKRRLGIAQALIGNPRIIVVDEPTTGLDPVITSSIHRLIKTTHDKYGFTAVIISHEVPGIFGIVDKVAVLHNGIIEQAGTPGEISSSTNPVVRQFITGSLEGPIDILS